MADEKGRMPLHIACLQSHERNLPCIELLLDSFPYATVHKLNSGSSSLELAACSELSFEVITLLTDTQTNTLRKLRDSFGFVMDECLGLPDLVVVKVWEYVCSFPRNEEPEE